jgi:glycogen synthase kinase 3 beta
VPGLIDDRLTDTIAEVIREKVQDGVTGETRDLQYTQCKIVGNGSFGVVFQTKLSPSGEDAAIKRVLQDKRFKVLDTNPACPGYLLIFLFNTEP